MTCKLYYNGRLNTATALVTINNRIAAVGCDAELCTRYNNADFKYNLQQRRVLPGFIESHAHFLGVGFSKMTLDLSDTTSASEIAMRVASLPKNAWITGHGWDQNRWDDTRFPSHELLTQASPDHPVALTRIDRHAIWCNARALQIAGLDLGQAVLVDHDMKRITQHIPKPSDADRRQAALLTSREALSLGITSFHDAGVSQNDISLFQSLLAEGEILPRLNLMLNGDDEDLVSHYLSRGPLIDDQLSIRSIKLFADGALGSRGAFLLEPYSDDFSNYGLSLLSREEIEHTTRRAIAHNFQVCTHAIGDAANRLVLDAYEQAGSFNQRLRIEHAQIIHPDDVARFTRLGVIASIQPTHYTSDLSWAPKRLGDKRMHEHAYPWSSLIKNSVKIAAGSDAPIESLDPLPALTLFPEAIKAYTIGGAYAEFQEHQKGRLAPGYLADFIVLSDNKVVMTVLGGATVYMSSMEKH